MREWMTTPSVMIDERRLEKNIRHMQQIAKDHHVNLRPHVKTHKTVEITKMQLDAGAMGITVSKPSEAIKFFHSGLKNLKSVLLAYPVVNTAKLCKILMAAQQFQIEFLLTVDSLVGLEAAEKAAISCDYPLKVLLHIDVGYHRCGLEEEDPRILEFAQRIEKCRKLGFGGILSHAGQAYSCENAAECAQVAEEERHTMVRVKNRLEEAGISVPIVSVGSTLTELARKNFVGITEIRPGNYVFMDRTPIRMGLCTIQEAALGIVVTVVSANKHFFIVDAGSKVLSSDFSRGGEETSFGDKSFGLVFYDRDFDTLVHEPKANKFKDVQINKEMVAFQVVKLSEEHGWVQQVEGIPSPALGQRMVILPNHSCPVVNLADFLQVQGSHPKQWKVFSRGCTQ